MDMVMENYMVLRLREMNPGPPGLLVVIDRSKIKG